MLWKSPFITLVLEPCADVIVSSSAAAGRRSILIGGGAPLVQKIGGSGAAVAEKFSIFAYLFQVFQQRPVTKVFLLNNNCAVIRPQIKINK